ncbi:unnamed protein product [Prorocentrum cordatum]|uniref:Methyltransferase domain-containing protein n=1 Tax=Prorocentrum cordatum TaxID=2364126 RepID=A0ABN9PY16_9DINO|nr:unnamed protein product [Polarella glacialis]
MDRSGIQRTQETFGQVVAHLARVAGCRGTAAAVEPLASHGGVSEGRVGRGAGAALVQRRVPAGPCPRRGAAPQRAWPELSAGCRGRGGSAGAALLQRREPAAAGPGRGGAPQQAGPALLAGCRKFGGCQRRPWPKFDYTLRCVVGHREPLPSRAGSAVFQAVGLLAVERRPRQGLGAGVVDAVGAPPPPPPGPWPRPAVPLEGSAAHALESLAAKAERHRLFADWLLCEFGGAEGLTRGDRGQEGGFVLEVAGGRGRLAEELSARGVPVTVVDPRCGPGEGARTHAVPVHFVRAAFDGDCAVRLAEGASAVVAMHPDEATEASIDAALAAALPFAVVPCCVFPRLFPARRLRGGQGVSGYAGLLRYLREKEPRIRAARLQFEVGTTHPRPEFIHDHRLEDQFSRVDMNIFGPGGPKYIHIRRPLGHQDVGSQAVDMDKSPPFNPSMLLGLLDGVRVDGSGGSRRIAGASPMRLDVETVFPHAGAADAPPMQRRCIGDAARSFDPIVSDPI